MLIKICVKTEGGRRAVGLTEKLQVPLFTADFFQDLGHVP